MNVFNWFVSGTFVYATIRGITTYIRELPKKPAPKTTITTTLPHIQIAQSVERKRIPNTRNERGETKTKKLRSENLVLLLSAFAASLCFHVCVCVCFIFVLRFGPAKTTAKRKKKKITTTRKSVRCEKRKNNSSLRHNLCCCVLQIIVAGAEGRNFICDAKNSLQAALFDTFLSVCMWESV